MVDGQPEDIIASPTLLVRKSIKNTKHLQWHMLGPNM